MSAVPTILVAFVFAALFVATLLARREHPLQRTGGEWLLDGLGLVVQGVVVPLLQAGLLAVVAARLLPGLVGTIDLPFAGAFAASFIVVDALYYGNHRLLHRSLWRWHAVHHTVRALDVLATSRNTLWTPLLIVYLWLNAAALVVLRHPAGFLLGMAVTSALDLWRHSSFVLPRRVHRLVSWLLITPHEHAWHHSRSRHGVNFGANLAIWDRMCGTWYSPEALPEELGIEMDAPFWRRLLWPREEAT